MLKRCEVGKKAVLLVAFFRNHFTFGKFSAKMLFGATRNPSIPSPGFLIQWVWVFQTEHLLSRQKQRRYSRSLSRYYLDMCIKRLCACVCECQCFCMFSAAGFAYCYNHNNCYLLWLLFHLLLLDAILLFCCCSNCRTFKCAPHTFFPIRPHIQNW